VQYPAKSAVRNAAAFDFSGLDLTDLPPDLSHGEVVLVQTDCTSTPNQSEWELQRVSDNFTASRGWFARHQGTPSMLDDPTNWIIAVVASAHAVAARYPTRVVLFWIGSGSVWEGTGFKTKSELLHRFAVAVSGCVFITMGNAVAVDGLVEKLCLCAYLLLSEELPFVQW
jgi:hypothetical protein